MSNVGPEKILLDVGSSTVKVYKYTNNHLVLLLCRSLPFKEGFSEVSGITEDNKTQLYELIKEIKEKHPTNRIKIYATALFRKLSPEARKSFADEFFERTNLFFNIIPHDLECFYLEVGLVGKYEREENVLLINIGGGSTELVVMYGKEAIEKHNLELGVGVLLKEYPVLNSKYSEVPLETVVEAIKERLPVLKNEVKVAFYTGGELNYMEIASYNLKENHLFKDSDHPKVISASDLFERNKEIFSSVSLEELEALMPNNPKWMHGARVCSALAQAIISKYNVETVVPSNSNLINGVVRQEVRHVTLSGSFRKHLEYILAIRKTLLEMGAEVLSPRFTKPKNPGEEFVVFSGEEGMTPLQLERHHLNSIDESDALIVCDKDGYVGASVLIEIGYANSIGKRIIFVEKPEEFMLNTLPAEIGL